jgi:hypothetical protein
MPATINGTSGFGGNLTGNVTGNADTATAATTAVTADKLTTTTGSAPVYACRAWVNFDGTRNEADTGASTNGANVKIRASGNVASVLKNGTGDYTVTFTTAMPDANYVAARTASTQITFGSGIVGSGSYTVSTGFVSSTGGGALNQDAAQVQIAIFR